MLTVNTVLAPTFAEIEFDSGPLQQIPLDEREKEEEDNKEIWTYAIILVIVFLIIRSYQDLFCIYNTNVYLQ